MNKWYSLSNLGSVYIRPREKKQSSTYISNIMNDILFKQLNTSYSIILIQNKLGVSLDKNSDWMSLDENIFI